MSITHGGTMNAFRFEPESLSPDNRVVVGKDMAGTFFVEVYSTARLRRIAELERLLISVPENDMTARTLELAIDEDSGLRMSAQGCEAEILRIARSYAILGETEISALRES